MKRREQFQKRLIYFIAIALSQGFFLYLYWINTDFIKNFKITYVKEVYAPLLSYQIKSFKKIVHQKIFTSGKASAENLNSNAQAIPVLLYHSIIENPDGANVLLINFMDQMKTLKQAGYTTIRITDFYEFLQNKKRLPEKSILITFDDGPKTGYYPVDPILETFDFNAVAYIITHYSIGDGSKFYLSSKEINKMLNSNRWEVQLHTDIGHTFYRIDEKGEQGRFYPNKLWREKENRLETDEEYKQRITEELIHGQQFLEQTFHIKNISFAYPFGDYAQNQTNYPQAKETLFNIVSNIFPIVFYQVYRGGGYTFNYPNESTFMRKRIIVQPEWNGKDLLHALESGTPKQLPYTDSLQKDQGWMNTWGKQTLQQETMILSTDNTEGGSIFLDGTYLWRNYVFSADIEWINGDSLSLLSRYKNNDTFVACNITDDYMLIEQVVDGKTKVLAQRAHNRLLRKGTSFHTEMEVNDNTVSCKENGTILVQAKILDPQLNTGGIGFKNWGVTIGESEVHVKNINVSSLP